MGVDCGLHKAACFFHRIVPRDEKTPNPQQTKRQPKIFIQCIYFHEQEADKISAQMVHFNYVYKWNAEQMLEALFQIVLPPPTGRVSVLILHFSLNSAWFEKLLRLKCLGPGALLAHCASEHDFFSFFWFLKYLSKLPFSTFSLNKQTTNQTKALEEWKIRFIDPFHHSPFRIDAPSFTCVHMPTHTCIHVPHTYMFHTHTYIYVPLFSMHCCMLDLKITL